MSSNEMKYYIKGFADIDTNSAERHLDDLISSLNKMGKTLTAEKITSQIENSIENVYDAFERLRLVAKDVFESPREVKEASAAYENYDRTLKELEKTLRGVSQLSSKNVYGAQYAAGMRTAVEEIKVFERKLSGLSNLMSKRLGRFSTPDISAMFDIKKIEQYAKIGANITPIISPISAKNTQELEKYKNQLESVEQEINKINSLKQKEDALANKENLDNLTKQQAILKEQVQSYEKNSKVLDNVIRKYQEFLNYYNNTKFNAEELFGEEYKSLGSMNLTELSDYVKRYRQDTDDAKESIEEMNASLQKLNNTSQEFGNVTKNAENAAQDYSNLKKQVDSLSASLANFFSLNNGWELFKTAVRNAYDTVKELDDAMTEIAVVSDYTLDEIWAKRKEYSDAATELGSKTIDLVDATKLYVQQGLELDEAMNVGIETIKMARIANLEGAEATDLMTTALRGFNLEMSEANKVNDTFSQLAAKSAADVYEIATALSKTASLANNAGASFENTSAFLTQIIETTR